MTRFDTVAGIILLAAASALYSCTSTSNEPPLDFPPVANPPANKSIINIPQHEALQNESIDALDPEYDDTTSSQLTAKTNSLHEELAGYPMLAQPRDIVLRLFPQNAQVLVLEGQELIPIHPQKTEKDKAWYKTNAGALLVSAPGFAPLVLPADSPAIENKLERNNVPLKAIGELSTRYQPKSVRFSENGDTMYVAHLGDHVAISRYSTEPFAWRDDWNVPKSFAVDGGFVEILILPERRELWVSQMTRNAIHIFNLDSGVFLDTVELSGTWPKVLLATSDAKKVYASCWLSETVVEIDTTTRKELRRFSTSGTPRGLIFSPDESELLVTIFSSSAVDRIALSGGLRVASHDVAPGHEYAMRHIVYDKKRREYYITAMGVKRVFRMSETGDWLGSWEVGDKPNSCAISPDGSRLFVSCRGPNNPDIGYLNAGYEFGKVYIINLNESQVEGWIWGRDQTTGLDVSPDGRYLAFTDFLSHNLELYRIIE